MSEQLIDYEAETPIRLDCAGDHIPGKPSRLSLFRWSLKGRRGLDGNLHKLESYLSSGKRWTSAEAIRRFLVAINAPSQPIAAPVTPSRRAKQNESARHELAAMGVR